MIGKRLIVQVTNNRAYAAVPGIQGIVVVTGPTVSNYLPGETPPPGAQYYDAILEPGADTPPQNEILYWAWMTDQGTIILNTNTFAPGVYPHTYAGWPLPGA